MGDKNWVTVRNKIAFVCFYCHSFFSKPNPPQIPPDSWITRVYDTVFTACYWFLPIFSSSAPSNKRISLKLAHVGIPAPPHSLVYYIKALTRDLGPILPRWKFSPSSGQALPWLLAQPPCPIHGLQGWWPGVLMLVLCLGYQEKKQGDPTVSWIFHYCRNLGSQVAKLSDWQIWQYSNLFHLSSTGTLGLDLRLKLGFEFITFNFKTLLNYIGHLA